MEKKGYKAFNLDMTNRYGRPFQEGHIYQVNEQPKFGNKGKGFHFCARLEDTLRYFPAMEEEISIAKVTALGDLVEYEDDYYGYYDMYSTNQIRIDHIMTREEIIEMYLAMPPYRVIRFIQGFHLTKEEIELFRTSYIGNEDIEKAIAYYQEKDTNAYSVGYQKQKLK